MSFVSFLKICGADQCFQDLIAQDLKTHGSFFIPIILSSNKTTVSVATGNNEYYPLYMSIGNIHNNVQHAHCNGVALLAFLAIPKSEFLFPIHFKNSL
jgi:hypothetical protein